MTNKTFYVTVEIFYSGLQVNKTQKEFYRKISLQEVLDILTDEKVPHDDWDKETSLHFENTYGVDFERRIVIDVHPAI